MLMPTVSRYMTRQPWTISPRSSLGDAQALMRMHEIRHLPVVDDGDLVGIVSDRDLRLYESVGGMHSGRVRDAMSEPVYTVAPSETIVDVALDDERAQVWLGDRRDEPWCRGRHLHGGGCVHGAGRARRSRDGIGTWDAPHAAMTATSASPRTNSALYLYMTRSHDYLRDLLERVLAAMQANARDDVHELWTELDHGLLAHMEAEERFVLPVFAHVDRDEARALLREHGLLRELLLDLGIAVDLHYVRYERSQEFAELLKHHAGREENLLYRWADERLSSATIERVKRHVTAR